jgi:NADP-dependent 3-hydroxy acid dehydrogenase YdfG
MDTVGAATWRRTMRRTVASAIAFAIAQPRDVEIGESVIRPTVAN